MYADTKCFQWQPKNVNVFVRKQKRTKANENVYWFKSALSAKQENLRTQNQITVVHGTIFSFSPKSLFLQRTFNSLGKSFLPVSVEAAKARKFIIIFPFENQPIRDFFHIDLD